MRHFARLLAGLILGLVAASAAAQQTADTAEQTIAMPQPVRLLTLDARYDDEYPAIAPDGKWIVFSRTSIERGATARLWVMSVDGSALRPLSPEDFPLHCTRPAWSPDGTTIAFRAARADENAGGIWLISSDGVNPRRLTDEKKADDLYPAWSPDGTWLVFSRGPITQEATNHLVRVSLDGEEQQLTKGDYYDGRPSVAPDGRHIAFPSDRAGHHYPNTTIWIMSVAGGEATAKQFTAGQGAAPAWSPDGAWIAFTSNRTGAYGVYVKRVGGGPAIRVTEATGQDKAHPVWAPDGHRIVFESIPELGEGRIAVVDVSKIVTRAQ